VRWSDWDGAHHTNWQDPAVVLGEAKRGHRGHQSIQRHTLLIYGCRQPAWLRVHFQQHRERYRDTQRRDLLLLAQRLDPQYIPGKRRAPWRSTHAVILARAALAAGGGASSGHPSQDLGSSSLRRSSLVQDATLRFPAACSTQQPFSLSTISGLAVPDKDRDKIPAPRARLGASARLGTGADLIVGEER
jgi:hypothetical protein